MFHLDQFISQYVTKRPVSMFSADIEANRQSAGPADEDVDDGPTVCESCGMPLTENANYCANCGAKVEPFVEVEEDGAEEVDVCECAPTEEAPAEETTVEEAAAEDAGCCCGEAPKTEE